MPRAQANEEVQILRFFEDAPLEKAEVLFNIVKEKMRTRSAPNPSPGGKVPRKKEKHSDAVEVGTSPQRAESP
jgi:hypothetical protein